MNYGSFFDGMFALPRERWPKFALHCMQNYDIDLRQRQRMIEWAWQMSEFASEIPEVWQELWLRHYKPRPAIARIIQEPLQVWRSGTADGWAWTWDKSVAEWFANRLGENLPVHERWVTADQVLWITNGRQECEVIVNTHMNNTTTMGAGPVRLPGRKTFPNPNPIPIPNGN